MTARNWHNRKNGKPAKKETCREEARIKDGVLGNEESDISERRQVKIFFALNAAEKARGGAGLNARNCWARRLALKSCAWGKKRRNIPGVCPSRQSQHEKKKKPGKQPPPPNQGRRRLGGMEESINGREELN